MSMANIFIVISLQCRSDARADGVTNVGGILLDSSERFSWTCVQTAGEEAVVTPDFGR
jgi:hypothetical protein